MIGIILIALILLVIGCGAKGMYKPDCATKAANRANVAGMVDTRIAMGMAPCEYGHTPGHLEAQKLIDGEWYWLYDTWDGGVVAKREIPKGFTPLFYFDTKRFIELELELSTDYRGKL